MPRPSVLMSVLAGMTVAQVALVPATLALECPEPQANPGSGVIQEPQQEIDRLSEMMRGGDLDNRLEVIARDLKERYAAADNTELTNFMVAAYCPVVAQNASLSESEKDAKLAEFSEQAWDLLSSAGP
jgi:uncharacterized protein (DUF1778 family)